MKGTFEPRGVEGAALAAGVADIGALVENALLADDNVRFVESASMKGQVVDAVVQPHQNPPGRSEVVREPGVEAALKIAGKPGIPGESHLRPLRSDHARET